MRHRWKTFFKTFTAASRRDDIALRATAFSFHALFIMPPFFVVVLALLDLLLQGVMVPELLSEQLVFAAGEEAARALTAYLTTFASTGLSLTSLAAALLILLFAGSQMHIHLRRSFNEMWGLVDRDRPGARRALKERSAAFVFTFAVGLFFTALLFVSTLLFVFSHLVGDFFGVPASLLVAGNFLAVFVVVVLMFLVLYTKVSDVEILYRDALPGALSSAVLLIAGNYLLSLYVRLVPKISLYGIFAAFLVILVWTYLLGLFIFMGMEATRVYVQETGRTALPRGSYRFTTWKERLKAFFGRT